MPQFDKITFFNQIFWLLLLFGTFYILLLRLFLPGLGSVLKARNKKLFKSDILNRKKEALMPLRSSPSILFKKTTLCFCVNLFLFDTLVVRDFYIWS